VFALHVLEPFLFFSLVSQKVFLFILRVFMLTRDGYESNDSWLIVDHVALQFSVSKIVGSNDNGFDLLSTACLLSCWLLLLFTEITSKSVSHLLLHR